MEDELVVYSKPKSSISENIRTIRTNLQFTAVDSKIKTILVTSSISGEGKSFLSSNLAVSFAQMGKKTLIVDCDIRKGRLHKIFNVNSNDNHGLSNFLADADIADISKYLQKTHIKNLWLLSRGTVAPNPSELLGSPKLIKLLNVLKQNFDYIILDSTPTIGLPDALILSKLVDKVIILSCVDRTPLNLLQETKKMLVNLNAPIAGVVVNKVKDAGSSYYSKYYE